MGISGACPHRNRLSHLHRRTVGIALLYGPLFLPNVEERSVRICSTTADIPLEPIKEAEHTSNQLLMPDSTKQGPHGDSETS